MGVGHDVESVHAKLIKDFSIFMKDRGYACFEEAPIHWISTPDVLCLKRDYKRRETIIGEIKASRADFLKEKRNKKYLKSLNICNKFYFVCKEGLIKPEEVPEGCGLYWQPKDSLYFVCQKNAKAKKGECFTEKETWSLLLSFETKLNKLRER